jgi:hypothetical protein
MNKTIPLLTAIIIAVGSLGEASAQSNNQSNAVLRASVQKSLKGMKKSRRGAFVSQQIAKTNRSKPKNKNRSINAIVSGTAAAVPASQLPSVLQVAIDGNPQDAAAIKSAGAAAAPKVAPEINNLPVPAPVSPSK